MISWRPGFQLCRYYPTLVELSIEGLLLGRVDVGVMFGVIWPHVLWVASLSFPNNAEDKVLQLQIEGGEVLHTLQGQLGHAADKSLLLGQILFVSVFVLLQNKEESTIESSLRKDVTSLLLDELIDLACILPCARLGGVLLDKLPSCIHASHTQPFLFDERGGAKQLFLR